MSVLSILDHLSLSLLTRLIMEDATVEDEQEVEEDPRPHTKTGLLPWTFIWQTCLSPLHSLSLSL